MSSLTYRSGEEIKGGDRITYHGEPGEVEFVVTKKVGDAAKDWYLDQFPGGGVMVTASGFGSVFLGVNDIDEDDLEFTSRGEKTAT